MKNLPDLEWRTMKEFVIKGIKFDKDSQKLLALETCDKFDGYFDISNIEDFYFLLQEKIKILNKFMDDKDLGPYYRLNQQIYERFLRYIEIHQAIFC